MLFLKQDLGTGLASFGNKNNYVGIKRRFGGIKTRRIYLLKNKNEYMLRISEVYPSKIVFTSYHDFEPFVLDKNIKMLGEVVFWERSVLSEA